MGREGWLQGLKSDLKWRVGVGVVDGTVLYLDYGSDYITACNSQNSQSGPDKEARFYCA